MAGKRTAQITTDPVLDILADLGRDKLDKPEYPKKKRVEEAKKRYNELVEELEILKKRLMIAQSEVSDKPSKLQETIQKLRDENKKLRTELNSVKTRLSEVIGNKIIENNPVVTDLSDPYRPIALAEKFKHVYDEEWVIAFEDLERLKITEPKSLHFLAFVIRSADEFCGAVLKQMTDRIESLALDDITHVKIQLNDGETATTQYKVESSAEESMTSKRNIKRYIKDLCHLSVRGLIELFGVIHLKQMLKDHNIKSTQSGINSYVEKIVEHVWRMHLTDPPMVLKWQEGGSDFSKDISNLYTKSGTKVIEPVWPAVLLHEGGQVVCKGVVCVE